MASLASLWQRDNGTSPRKILTGQDCWQRSPLQPEEQVQEPSIGSQAAPLAHKQVRLQPKPQVPLEHRIEQSTPCQPIKQREMVQTLVNLWFLHLFLCQNRLCLLEFCPNKRSLVYNRVQLIEQEEGEVRSDLARSQRILASLGSCCKAVNERNICMAWGQHKSRVG